MNDTAVKISGVFKDYRDKNVLSGVDLDIQKGQIFALLGPNGAGKSTLLKLIVGLIQADKGEIEILGENIKNKRISILKKTGAFIEAPKFYDHLTGYENLFIASKLKHCFNKSHLDELLQLFTLYNDRKKSFKSYSMGMKQRLGLAAAFLNNPELLILDEPTNGLDPEGIYQVKEILKKTPQLFNSTIIMSSHILSDVEEIADRIGIIDQGKIRHQAFLSSKSEDKNVNIIEMRVQDFPAAEIILKRHSYKYQIVHETFHVEADEARSNFLQEKLIAGKVFLYSYQARKYNLEETYMKIMRQADGNERINNH